MDERLKEAKDLMDVVMGAAAHGTLNAISNLAMSRLQEINAEIHRERTQRPRTAPMALRGLESTPEQLAAAGLDDNGNPVNQTDGRRSL